MNIHTALFLTRLWVSAAWVIKILWIFQHFWFVKLDSFIFILVLMCSYVDPVIFNYFGRVQISFYNKEITKSLCVMRCVGLGVAQLILLGLLLSFRLRFFR